MTLKTVEILPDGKALELAWEDGSRTRFHAIWLRDNGLDAETRSPTNGQRLITVLDIPRDTTVFKAAISEQGALCVVIAPEMKALVFPDGWLKRHAYDYARTRNAGCLDPAVETWDSALRDQLPTGKWDLIFHSRPALGEWAVSG